MHRAVITLIVAALTLGLFSAATTVDSDTDNVSCWCDVGVKLESAGTQFTVPEPPDGYRWSLLVIKAGSVQSVETANHLAADPVVAAAYSHPSGEKISHVILCEEPVETPATTTTSTTTSTSSTTTTTAATTTTTAAPNPIVTSTTTAATTTTTAATTTTESTTTSTTAATGTTSPPPDTTPTTMAIQEQRDQLPVTGPSGYLPVAAVAAVGLLTLSGAALYGTRKQHRNTLPR